MFTHGKLGPNVGEPVTIPWEASTKVDCLNSCAIGGSHLIRFCASSRTPQLAALCYAAAAAGEVACAGFCYNNY